jgi:hypothetical protein
MPSYLVETYLTAHGAETRATAEARARSATAELTRDGVRVGFDGAIHVPEDETCFFVFVAGSAAEAAHVARLAQLDPVRIVEAITSREEYRCSRESS